jgi:TolA-binding protein
MISTPVDHFFGVNRFISAQIKLFLFLSVVLVPRTLAQRADNDATESFHEARTLFESNMFVNAADAFASFRKRFPDDARVSDSYYYEAESSLAGGREDRAIALLKEFDRRYPRHPFSYQAHLTLGKYFYETGSFDRAIETLSAVVRDGPADEKAAIALYWMGESATGLEQYDRALSFYDRILRDFPSSETAPRAGYAVAYNQVHLKRYDSAARSFELLAERYPDSELSRNIGLALAEVYYETDDYKNVVEEINRRMPNLGPEARERATFLLAESYNQLRDSKNAILNYRHFVEGNTNNPYFRRALYGLAWNYHHEGAFEWSADNFRLVRGAQKDDLSSSAMYYEAVNLKLAYQLDRAEEVFRAFIAEYPHADLIDHAWFELGVLLYENRQWREANRVFAGLVDRFPSSDLRGQALMHLGNTFIATGDFDEALDAFDKAIGLEATASELKDEIIFQKAWLLYRNRDYARAAPVFMKLFSENSGSADAGETLFWAAESFFQLDEFDRSARLFSRYLREFPDEKHVDAAHYALGWAFFRQQKYELAIPEFERFLSSNTTDTGTIPYVADARLRLADSYFALKQYGNAVKVYGRAAGEGDDYALYQIGQAYSNAGDPFEAISTFQKLLEEQPLSEWREEAQYSLGYLYFQNQEFEPAITSYKRLIRTFPSDPLAAKAQYGIGDAEFNAGNLDAALLAYQKVLSKYPESPFAADAAAGIQFALLANDEEDRAEAIIDSFLVQNPDSPVLDQLRFRQAEVRYQSGDEEVALRQFQQFIRSARDESLLPEAYFYLGSIYADRKARTEAITYLGQLLERYPDSPRYADAARLLGHVYLDNSSFPEAESVFRALETARPDDIETVAEARYGRSMALTGMGREDEAEAVLLEAIRSAPEADSTTPAYLGLARLRLAEGDREEAERLFELVVSRSRSEYGAEALYLSGKSFLDDGRPQDAIETLGRMNTLYGGYPDWMAKSLIRQAEAFLALGERGQAVQLYQQVLDDYAGTDMAAEAKEALKRTGQ